MKLRHRTTIALVGALGLAAAPVAAHAQQTVTEPAPPGSASATAAAVNDVIEVSKTKAEAGPDSASASASALNVNGKPVAAQVGGSQDGEGSSSGALVDLGQAGMGRLAVTPWSATVEDDGTQRSATGEASVAELTVRDENTLDAKVLHSRSHATHTDAKSIGSSSTDGADVRILGPGGLHVVILHSEASTENGGTTYLLSVNGNEIGSSDQIKQACSIQIPGALKLLCLSVAGGEDSVRSLAGEANVGDGDLVAGLFVATGAGSGNAAPAGDPTGDGSGDGSGNGSGFSPADDTSGGFAAQVLGQQVGDDAAADAARGQAAGALPRTGFESLGWFLSGLGLMITGGALRTASRFARVRG